LHDHHHDDDQHHDNDNHDDLDDHHDDQHHDNLDDDQHDDIDDHDYDYDQYDHHDNDGLHQHPGLLEGAASPHVLAPAHHGVRRDAHQRRRGQRPLGLGGHVRPGSGDRSVPVLPAVDSRDTQSGRWGRSVRRPGHVQCHLRRSQLVRSGHRDV